MVGKTIDKTPNSYDNSLHNYNPSQSTRF